MIRHVTKFMYRGGLWESSIENQSYRSGSNLIKLSAAYLDTLRCKIRRVRHLNKPLKVFLKLDPE